VGGTSHATASGTPCPDAADPLCVPLTRSDGTRLRPGALGWGGTVSASHIGTHHFEDASVDVLSPLLDPNDAGFLPQFNKQQLNLSGGYQERQPGRVFQNYSLRAEQEASRDFSGTRTSTSTLLGFNGFFLSQWFVNPAISYEWAGTWDTRETLDGGRFQRVPA
jgi:hypothetical protein